MIYAKIDSGKVTNIIELDEYNATEFPDYQSTHGLDICIGDDFKSGKFFRDGVEIVNRTEELEKHILKIDDIEEKTHEMEMRLHAVMLALAQMNPLG